jgi:hypothetical protein
LSKRDKQRLEAAQNKFLRPLLGFTKLDHQRNTDSYTEKNNSKYSEDICDYEENFKNVERIQSNRLLYYKLTDIEVVPECSKSSSWIRINGTDL